MENVCHKICVYFLTLLTLMAVSACRSTLNTLGDSHFTEEGTLVEKPTFAKLDYNSAVQFYVESSGSMNGFFRSGMPTAFKQDVYNVMSYYEPQEINVMTNDGGVAFQMSLPDFQTAMNTGALQSNASTKIPVMLRSIIGNLKKNDVAVLISDMKYSPVGAAAPNVLMTQYAAEVAAIAGNSKKAFSLLCAVSNYVDKQGNSIEVSPYYYLIIGDQDKVSAIRNGIAIKLQENKRFIDNLEIGYKYATCPYSFGMPRNVVQLGNEPTFYGYDDSQGDCVISLKLHLEPYRWIMSNKEVLKQCFVCKANYGSTVSIVDFQIEECNNVDLKLRRSAIATVRLKVSNMMNDMEVLEWNLNIPYRECTLMNKFFDGAIDENDPTKSYSVEDFVMGISQGGVVNIQPKANYILISKNNI